MKILHGLGYTGLGLKRSPAARRKVAASRRRTKGLPAYWKKILHPELKRKKPKKKSSPRRRKNAWFSQPERHGSAATTGWRPWPRVSLYTLIKRYGVKGGQAAYRRMKVQDRKYASPRRRKRVGQRGKPASRKGEVGMARRTRRRRNPRGRKTYRALVRKMGVKRAASAWRKMRHNPSRRRRVGGRRRTRRRRNSGFTTYTANPRRRRRRRRSSARRSNPRRRRRRSRRRFASNPVRRRRRTRRRRRNSGFTTYTANPRRRRRRRRHARRSNPRRRRHARRRHYGSRRRRNPFSVGGFMANLKASLPTLEDAKVIGVMAGFGVLQDMFAWRVAGTVGIDKLQAMIPWFPGLSEFAFSLGGTFLTGLLLGPRWAKPVMYGGLTSYLKRVVEDRAVSGMFGSSIQQYAQSSSLIAKSAGATADYVTFGRRGGMNDYVTFGESAYGTESVGLPCPDDEIEPDVGPGMVEPGMSDYYGVTAF